MRNRDSTPSPGHGQGRAVHHARRRDWADQRNHLVALLEKYRREALGASLLAVYGVWQTKGKVHHLIAKALRGRGELLGALRVESHDFH
ncbi:hypothetical protein EDD84_00315 (plasmid) [Burkholderia gladioli]|nr:hypothetical protein CO712_35860 [Burkholderia gladioli pv. gladioli]AYQ86007.1 hypothetical protein EDD84_00315 [Burkholderia gladioli]